MAYLPQNNDVMFADTFLSKQYGKAQNDFFNQIDILIDWRPTHTLLNKKYTKRQNAVGASAYDVISLFKILLFKIWYSQSNCALEEEEDSPISFSRFFTT